MKTNRRELLTLAAAPLILPQHPDVVQLVEHWERGEPISVRQHTLIRLAMGHVTWSSQEVATFVYKTVGTMALRAGTIQRLFRDMHAGTQHVTSSPPVFRAIGRELAGLAAGKKWVFLDVVDAAR